MTAFNERAVKTLETSGFYITKEGVGNPIYSIKSGFEEGDIVAYSKIYPDPVNPDHGFAAVMTCDHADENCPFIPGVDLRIPLRYEDPKAFDDTGIEAKKYMERSLEIGS